MANYDYLIKILLLGFPIARKDSWMSRTQDFEIFTFKDNDKIIKAQVWVKEDLHDDRLFRGVAVVGVFNDDRGYQMSTHKYIDRYLHEDSLKYILCDNPDKCPNQKDYPEWYIDTKFNYPDSIEAMAKEYVQRTFMDKATKNTSYTEVSSTPTISYVPSTPTKPMDKSSDILIHIYYDSSFYPLIVSEDFIVDDLISWTSKMVNVPAFKLKLIILGAMSIDQVSSREDLSHKLSIPYGGEVGSKKFADVMSQYSNTLPVFIVEPK